MLNAIKRAYKYPQEEEVGLDLESGSVRLRKMMKSRGALFGNERDIFLGDFEWVHLGHYYFL